MTFAERQRARQERMTPERIVEIARRDGSFSVSLRHRDDWLRRRCAKLRKKRLLRGGHRIIRGAFVFYPVQQEQT